MSRQRTGGSGTAERLVGDCPYRTKLRQRLKTGCKLPLPKCPASIWRPAHVPGATAILPIIYRRKGIIQITSSCHPGVHRWPQNLVLPLLSNYRPVLNIFFLSLFLLLAAGSIPQPGFLGSSEIMPEAQMRSRLLFQFLFLEQFPLISCCHKGTGAVSQLFIKAVFIVGSSSNCSLRAGTPQCSRLSRGAPSGRAGFSWCQLLGV